MFYKTFFPFTGIVLLIVFCVLGYTFSPTSLEATAQMQPQPYSERFWAENWIQFSFSPSSGHFDSDLDTTPFDLFVNTQIALIKSPMVLEAVVKNPSIAQLPNLRTQVNPAAWIASKLAVEGALTGGRRSEIYVVSFDSPNPQEAEMIVNAVVDSYLRYYRLLTSQQEQTLQKTLANEKANREKNIQSLQSALGERLKNQTPNTPSDVETANLVAKLDRENRTLEVLNDQLLRIGIAQTTSSRVRLLYRTAPYADPR